MAFQFYVPNDTAHGQHRYANRPHGGQRVPGRQPGVPRQRRGGRGDSGRGRDQRQFA